MCDFCDDYLKQGYIICEKCGENLSHKKELYEYLQKSRDKADYLAAKYRLKVRNNR